VQAESVLRIVGTGPEREHLEHLAGELAIADRVQFLDQLSFQALAAEYRNATVFALPTLQEGFGIVFLEAMASSLPIVAGRAAAVPEIVDEGVNGFLVDPDDHVTLAQTLARLLEKPETRQAMGSAGFDRVRQYDSPIVARRFLELLGIA
jgi:glycosyltransferase involved in cell wall biosynthesis